MIFARSLRHIVVGIVGIAIIVLSGLLAGAVTDPKSPQTAARADVIPLDELTALGKLEYPLVYFIHDKHTKALAEQGKSCEACHPKYKSEITNKELQSPKFKRVDNPTDMEAFRDLYHDACISCHKETAARKLESGPVECRDCHTPQPRAESNRLPFGFDLSLHYRHSKAAEKKCEVCHHEYNKAEKKLVYKEKQEGTCRYCHLSDSTKFLVETEPERVANLDMKQASHLQCIACHQDIKAEKKADKKFGPIECSGCHSPEAQAAIEPVKDRPRMERDQPDAALIHLEVTEIKGRMAPVPFNHQIHEQNIDSCRVCHHASMTACTDCHTMAGSKKSSGIQLEGAMHQAGSDRSCLGCHETRKTDPQCAGCHAFIAKDPVKDSGCLACHADLDGKAIPVDKKARSELAAQMLADRKTLSATYKPEDVPETVTISVLSDQYQPVKLPHRKIVDSLAAKMKENKLGEYFHTGDGGLCQGCHHNSPASKEPPRCASCHGRPFDSNNSGRPGLTGAYHIQCIGCHEEMGLEKPAATACTECHEKKKN